MLQDLQAVAMPSLSEKNQNITLSEESNCYKFNLTTLFIQDKPQLTFNNQIIAFIDDYKHGLLDSGNFNVTLQADQEVLLKFQIFFMKKEESQCNLNARVLPGVRLLSTCVAFKECMVLLPQRTQPKNISKKSNICSQLTVESFTHQFIFDQLHDTFQVSLRIENPQEIVDYQCLYYFGLFGTTADCYILNQQQQVTNNTQLFKQLQLNNEYCKDRNKNKTVVLKQEEIQIEEEIPQGSELSSTKSNQFIASPQLLPWKQQEFNQYPILREKIESEQQDQIVGETSQLKQSEKRQSFHKTKKFDKKNVVKNFVKAFDIYFSDKQRDDEFTQILGISVEKLIHLRQIINSIERSLKYNNKMIIQIVNSELNEVFKLFLKTQALAWIKSSSVFDKSAHITILKDYITAASNPQEINKLINLRVRNRISAKK